MNDRNLLQKGKAKGRKGYIKQRWGKREAEEAMKGESGRLSLAMFGDVELRCLAVDDRASEPAWHARIRNVSHIGISQG